MKCFDLVPLSNITMELESGSRPKGGIVEGQGDVFSIGGEHLDDFGGFNLSSRKLVPDYFFKMMTRGIVKPNDILIVKDGATTGKISFVSENFPKFPCCINEHVFRLSVKKDFSDARYVFYYLYSPKGNREIMNDFRGATVGGISQEFVEKINIPLPPLPEQRRIAALLAKADRLRRLRRYTMQLGDTYLQSVFLEMFGDPVRNTKKWEIKDFGSQMKDIRYGTGSPPLYQENGIPFIRATNIKGGTVVENGLVFISESAAVKISKCKVKVGNLIIVRSGVNTGDCALIPKKYHGAYAAYDLIIEVPYPQNYYYNYLINSEFGKSVIEPLSRRAGQPHINADQVQSLTFSLPPLSQQERFAIVVRRYEHLRAQQRESARQTEMLFQSLLKSAFEGNL